MRICLVGPTYPLRGGIAHYTTLLYRALAERHEVLFLTFRRGYPKWLVPAAAERDRSGRPIAEPGVVALISPLRPWSWLHAAWRIVLFQPDLVVVPWWVTFWAPVFWTLGSLARLLSGARIVYLCHNVIPHERRPGDLALTRLAFGPVHGFIVHSREDGRNLRRLRPLAAVRRSPHPTYETFAAEGVTRPAARRALGLAEAEPLALFFGFVRPYKGLEVLLRAMPAVRRDLPLRLLVVGEFWHGEAEARSLIESLGVADAVTLVNRYVPNEEVERYFAAADVVVLPYLSATGSGIGQIAFGHGRSVIATAVGSLPEVVEDGRTGLIVPPADPRALAAALVRFFREDLRDGFERAVAASRDRFAWRHMVEAIEAFAA